MTFQYPAVFKKTESGGYTAYFPDLEMCTAKGETLTGQQTVSIAGVISAVSEGWDE